MFTKTFHVRWADLDSNGHMKNTAYLDVCVDARMMFFAENGFGGWLDLQERRLIRPPERLRSVLAQLQRTEDFAELPASIRS